MHGCVMLLCLCLFVSGFTKPSEADDSRPNIVLIFPDEWRFDWADEYYIDNLSLNTPTFSELVSKGTRFVNNCVGSPLCAPSRACLASGKEYDHTGVPSNNYDFPINESTFYDLMRSNGYHIMISGKDDLVKETGCGINGDYRASELGMSDQRRVKGKEDSNHPFPTVTDPYAVYLSEHYNTIEGINTSEWLIHHECFKHCCTNHACPGPVDIHPQDYQDNYITTTTMDMLDAAPIETPWFLQINWAGPHPPFIILESMKETVENRTFPHAMSSTDNKEIVQIARRDYTAEIENLDAQFAIILQKFKNMGQYNNTVFCLSSDHGEMLGDFSAWGKTFPWVASSNVPLVCMGPRIKQNQTIETYVTNMDLAGTFMDYSETKKNSDMTTESLKPFLVGTWNDEINDYRQYVSSGLNNWRMAVEDINETTTWKFICCQGKCPVRKFKSQDGLTQVLFNVFDDLYELNDLAAVYPDVVERMRTYLPDGFCVPGDYTEKWRYLSESNEFDESKYYKMD